MELNQTCLGSLFSVAGRSRIPWERSLVSLFFELRAVRARMMLVRSTSKRICGLYKLQTCAIGEIPSMLRQLRCFWRHPVLRKTPPHVRVLGLRVWDFNIRASLLGFSKTGLQNC